MQLLIFRVWYLFLGLVLSLLELWQVPTAVISIVCTQAVYRAAEFAISVLLHLWTCMSRHARLFQNHVTLDYFKTMSLIDSTNNRPIEHQFPTEVVVFQKIVKLVTLDMQSPNACSGSLAYVNSLYLEEFEMNRVQYQLLWVLCLLNQDS